MAGGIPHDELEFDDLHIPQFFIQSSDPGAVGAGTVWIDSTALPWTFYVRNDLDTLWIVIGALPPPGTIDYAYVSANDPATDVTGAELEELTDGSSTTLHTHPAAGGEANTASNQGAGVGLFDGKVAVDLQFRSLVEADAYLAIVLDGASKEVDLGLNFATLEGDLSHLNIGDIGTNSHAALDLHVADLDIHFEEGDISHLNIQDIGTNDHPAIDTHIAAINNPHSVTPAQVGNDVAQWNADEIQDFPVSTTDPVEGDFLRLDSGVWTPYQLIIGSEYSCKAHLTVDQSVPKLVWTALSYGDTVWDTQTYWSIANPTRITIPAGQSGRYAFRGNCIWDTITEDSSTQSRLYLNGVSIPASHSGQYINKAAGGATWLPTANLMVYDLYMDAGDYIEFYVWLSVSTATAIDALGDSDENYASWLSIERIE